MEETQTEALRNNLPFKIKFALADMLQREYTASGLSDAAFAAQASEKVGHSVKPSQIAYYRTEFGIHKNGLAADATRIEALEHRVVVLERRLDVYFSSGKGAT